MKQKFIVTEDLDKDNTLNIVESAEVADKLLHECKIDAWVELFAETKEEALLGYYDAHDKFMGVKP